MRDPFDFWNENGKLLWEQGDARVYEVDGQRYLFVDQTMYASTTERDWYIHNLMSKVRGQVLEFGLGLGVASLVMLAAGLTHLTTIEKNKNVIWGYGRPLPFHNVIESDADVALEALSRSELKYDFIFIDHYAHLDEETLDYLRNFVEKCRNLLVLGGNLVVWYDETLPDPDIASIRALWI